MLTHVAQHKSINFTPYLFDAAKAAGIVRFFESLPDRTEVVEFRETSEEIHEIPIKLSGIPRQLYFLISPNDPQNPETTLANNRDSATWLNGDALSRAIIKVRDKLPKDYLGVFVTPKSYASSLFVKEAANAALYPDGGFEAYTKFIYALGTGYCYVQNYGMDSFKRNSSASQLMTGTDRSWEHLLEGVELPDFRVFPKA